MRNMRTTRLAILSGMLVLAAALPVAAQTGPPGGGGSTMPPETSCPMITVSGVEKPTELSRSRFSAVETPDLVFHVMFPWEITEDLVVTLKVYTPHGHLYRTLDVPVAPPKGTEITGNTTRRLPGYPYPVRVKTPRNVTYNDRRYQTVDVSLPVAGSVIVTSSLYGQWSVEVIMDGASTPCPERTRFVIFQ